METRANYVLIGAFTLLGIVGGLGFLLWLAKVDVERSYAYYDVLFENVSGLGTAGDVRYNGLPVGQVVALNLDPDDPAKVRVRLEVRSDTPVRADTVATLQSQGVTGVSFVALSGGTAEAAPLPDGGTIPSERSAIQTIFEGAPELLEKAVSLLEDINRVVDEDNRDAITEVLDNLASASGRMDRVLSDFESLSGDLGLAAREVAAFSGRLGALSETAETTLQTATRTLDTANDAIVRAEGAIDAAVGTLDAAETAFATADGLMREDLTGFIRQGTDAAATLNDVVTRLEPAALATVQAAQALTEQRLPALMDSLASTAATLETRITTIGGEASGLIDRVSGVAGRLEGQIATLGGEASGVMARYEALGEDVQARVAQAESVFASVERAADEAAGTLESVRGTAESAQTFIDTEAGPLSREARATLGAARTLAEDRLPGLIDRAEGTLATVDREVAALSTDARDMIEAATARLDEARQTIARLDQTLSETERTMVSVRETSDTANALLAGDGAALVADARAAAAEARAAISGINAAVERDLPDLMAEVRGATATANRVIDTLGRDATALAGRLEGLADEGGITLAAATETFTNANATLAAVTTAMENAEGTLTAAEQTFVSVNRILDEDVDLMVGDIRGAVTAFSDTLEKVSGEVDTISAEVLDAARSASNLVGNVDQIVADNRLQVSDFLRVGLPQFQRFIFESRRLVTNLERLVTRIERDPGRFLLGTNSSEYRR
ncbi:MAG: MlaD family protein [Rhodobacteraceae bacterium]|nr:MlaD family protein [Paracoccaceae bacterium]